MNRESIHGEISVNLAGKGSGPRIIAARMRWVHVVPGLVRRRDEDVVVTWHEVIPTGAVEVVVAVLPGSLGWFEPHGSTSSHGTILEAEPKEPDWHRPSSGEQGHPFPSYQGGQRVKGLPLVVCFVRPE